MGFEVDILEREEKYRSRVTRMIVVFSVVVAAAVGTGFYLLDRQQKNLAKTQAEAAEAAQRAEIARLRAAYSADSSAAANRVADFTATYNPQAIEGAPLSMLPVPANMGMNQFLNKAWNDFTSVVTPNSTEPQKQSLYSLYYVDVMNRAWYNSLGRIVWSGEKRPKGMLVPDFRQRGTEVEILKSTFPQIVRGQQTAGIRVLESPEELEGAAADSSLAQSLPTDGSTEASDAPDETLPD